MENVTHLRQAAEKLKQTSEGPARERVESWAAWTRRNRLTQGTLAPDMRLDIIEEVREGGEAVDLFKDTQIKSCQHELA